MIATAGLLAITARGMAQSSLTDYANGTVDLGMGITQSQKLSTAATQTISGEELQKTAAISLKDALYGRLLGLTALKNGKFEGDNDFGARMNVRGTQTTSENKLLILVDGIERSIDYLTPEEVESVTVLRDGAATALYGYEGLGGAILVKTKRGKADIWGGNTTYGTNNVVAQIQASGFQKSHARLFQGDLTLKQDLSGLLKGLSATARFGYNNYSEIYEGNTMGFMYGYERYTFDANGNRNGLTSYSAGDKTDNLSFNYWQNQHSRKIYRVINQLTN